MDFIERKHCRRYLDIARAVAVNPCKHTVRDVLVSLHEASFKGFDDSTPDQDIQDAGVGEPEQDGEHLSALAVKQQYLGFPQGPVHVLDLLNSQEWKDHMVSLAISRPSLYSIREIFIRLTQTQTFNPTSRPASAGPALHGLPTTDSGNVRVPHPSPISSKRLRSCAPWLEDSSKEAFWLTRPAWARQCLFCVPPLNISDSLARRARFEPLFCTSLRKSVCRQFTTRCNATSR